MKIISSVFRFILFIFTLGFFLGVALFLFVGGTALYLLRGRRPPVQVHTQFRQNPFQRPTENPFERREEKDVTPKRPGDIAQLSQQPQQPLDS